MKTKEIDVFLEPEIANRLLNEKELGHFTCYKYSDFCTKIKAKVVIEIPEKKITISESELREAFFKLFDKEEIPDSPKQQFKDLKKELFGDKRK